MPRRNSPHSIQGLADLSRLAEIVVDKRRGQRAAAKKNRRNRHYEKQFIRHTLTHLPLGPAGELGADHADEADGRADDADAPGPPRGAARAQPPL